MNDKQNLNPPTLIPAIEKATEESGFNMASDHQTGSILRTLVASKNNGKVLELGTGTGLSTCWLLDGMDEESKLISVDNDDKFVDIAKKYLGDDKRVEFYVMDGTDFLEEHSEQYDLIFADTWPGKYDALDKALELLKVGGLYIIDDMLPQENWPEDHPHKVKKLIKELEEKVGFQITKLNWSTGIIIVSKM